MHELTKQFLESEYTFIRALSEDRQTILVCNGNTSELYVKKRVDAKTASLYEKLLNKTISALPRVVQVINDGGSSIVMMEFVNGLPLDKIIEQDGPMPSRQAKQYLSVLCGCVKELHSLKIIHRDITASNIIISGQSCYLIDLGIAREKKGEQRTDTQILGTVGYAAPEQFGFEQSDERTDIYALGTVFHFMLTGALPNQQTYKGREREIIKKCTAIDRQKRYQSISELEAALSGKNKKKRLQLLAVAASIICFFALSLFTGRLLLKKQLPALLDYSTPPYNVAQPPPSSAALTDKTMTRNAYEQIQTGMTYDEVVRIAGNPSYSNSDVKSMGIRYQNYTWTGTTPMANAVILFQNGKVVGKSQYGLQ